MIVVFTVPSIYILLYQKKNVYRTIRRCDSNNFSRSSTIVNA